MKGDTWHWYDLQDSYYRKAQATRKKTAKWCRGRVGTYHNYQPYDKYDWVVGGISRYSFSLPWVLHFAKCEECGREKIWSVDNPNYDAADRERHWDGVVKLRQAEQVEQERSVL